MPRISGAAERLTVPRETLWWSAGQRWCPRLPFLQDVVSHQLLLDF